MTDATLAGILWVAAIAVLAMYLVRRKKRASRRQRMMENLRD
jgi:LPXTG-motif cell wall-anchored protein